MKNVVQCRISLCWFINIRILALRGCPARHAQLCPVSAASATSPQAAQHEQAQSSGCPTPCVFLPFFLPFNAHRQQSHSQGSQHSLDDPSTPSFSFLSLVFLPLPPSTPQLTSCFAPGSSPSCMAAAGLSSRVSYLLATPCPHAVLPSLLSPVFLLSLLSLPASPRGANATTQSQ